MIAPTVTLHHSAHTQSDIDRDAMRVTARDAVLAVSALVGLIAALWPVLERASGTCPYGYGSRATPALAASARVFTDCRIRTAHGDARADVVVSELGRVVAVEPRAARARANAVSCARSWMRSGFVDAHVHVVSGGLALADVVDLGGVRGREGFADALAGGVGRRRDGWVLARGWDETRWDDTDGPHGGWLDERFDGVKVWAMRTCGHAGFASEAALRAGGLDGPARVLREGEMAAVVRAIPRLSRTERDRAMRRGLEHLSAHGITAVGDFGDIESLLAGPSGYDALWEDFETLERWDRAGELPVRVTWYAPLGDYRRAAAHPAWNDGWTREDAATGTSSRVRIGGVKAFLDGSLGGRTAAFFEPYADDPSTRGQLIYNGTDEDVLREQAIAADALGLQIAVHAIGDAAVEQALALAEAIEKANGRRAIRRFRIEHSQHLTFPMENQVKRYRDLGVVASVQPAHITLDEPSVARRLGSDRALRYSALRTFANHSVPLAGGSDWPIVDVDVFDGVRAAVIRKREALSVDETLRMFTTGAAAALRLDGLIGALIPGAFADFVILDRAPEDVVEGERPVVIATYVGGECVYGRCL